MLLPIPYEAVLLLKLRQKVIAGFVPANCLQGHGASQVAHCFVLLRLAPNKMLKWRSRLRTATVAMWHYINTLARLKLLVDGKEKLYISSFPSWKLSIRVSSYFGQQWWSSRLLFMYISSLMNALDTVNVSVCSIGWQRSSTRRNTSSVLTWLYVGVCALVYYISCKKEYLQYISLSCDLRSMLLNCASLLQT